MSRILLTGVTGFTGRYLAPLLTAQGHEVLGLATHSKKQIYHEPAFHSVDITDTDALCSFMREYRPRKVVHLAGVSFVGHNQVEDFYLHNIVGTRNLLQALQDNVADPEHIIIASSANVYGNQHFGQMDETTVPAPVNDYGISKLAAEHVAAMFATRLPITITRPFNYTGVGQSTDMLIPKIVNHVKTKAEFIELGNVDIARDFSDVRYVATIYSKLLNHPQAIGKTVNICSGQAYSLKEILRLAAHLGNHEPKIKVNSELVRKYEVQALWGSTSYLQRWIGPTPMPTLEETLRWMIESEECSTTSYK